jgi:hypothetical protein
MYIIKYRIKRLRVHWRQWQNSIDNTMISDKRKLTAYEEKAVKLWKLCLKDGETQMTYNTNGVRQIEKDNLLILLQPNGSHHIMTIIDVNKLSKSLYEFHIPQKDSDSVCEYFDVEMGKRMRKTENQKRSIIETDIDRLIKNQENIIKK